MLKFDIEVFQRTAVFDVPADCMESAYAVVEQAYDEWVENVDEICGASCCEEWICQKVIEAGYKCGFIKSIDWRQQ